MAKVIEPTSSAKSVCHAGRAIKRISMVSNRLDQEEREKEILATAAAVSNVAEMSDNQKFVKKMNGHLIYQMLISLVIIFHMFLTVYETDQSAAGTPRHDWQVVLERSFLSLYIQDLVMRVYVFRVSFFREKMNLFDMFIVVSDGVATLLDMTLKGGADIGPVSLLRALRALRIMRLIRSLTMFRDLYLMLKGMSGALRAIFFSTFFIFVVLTMFSILAVEMVHPLNLEIADTGLYGDCERCPMAFKTVMSSNLTFFSCIIAGDSWGRLALPLMEKAPWTAFVILGAFVVVELGLLNVIVAVVVDRQAQAREEDKGLLYMLKQEQSELAYRELVNLFKSMDDDDSGALTEDELLDSYDADVEFRDMLQFLDIAKEDIPLMFRMMDKDRTGTVDYEEFVKELHGLKTLDMRTLMFFTRQHTVEAKEKIDTVLELTQRKFDDYDASFRRLLPLCPGGGPHFENAVNACADHANGSGHAEKGVPSGFMKPNGEAVQANSCSFPLPTFDDKPAPVNDAAPFGRQTSPCSDDSRRCPLLHANKLALEETVQLRLARLQHQFEELEATAAKTVGLCRAWTGQAVPIGTGSAPTTAVSSPRLEERGVRLPIATLAATPGFDLNAQEIKLEDPGGVPGELQMDASALARNFADPGSGAGR